MSYLYGTQGAPAVGTGAPGLPQRLTTLNGDTSGPPVQALIIRANTNYVTPDWATYCRVTAIGKGGQGLGGLYGAAVGSFGANGGGGGGLAATNIESVSPGTPININFDTGSALVSFLNYQLSGGKGGDANTSFGGAAGIGAGGAINFNGGAGENAASSSSAAGGGGAAGRKGGGVNGGIRYDGVTSPASGGNSGPGDTYTTGGGAGGVGFNSTGSAVGYGAFSRADQSSLGAVLLGRNTYTLGSVTVADGGDCGGGSGGSLSASVSNLPGAALVLIELW